MVFNLSAPAEPLIVLSPVRDAAAVSQADPVNPALCALVVLVTLGAILALAVWVIIYRRQTGLSRTSGTKEMTCFYDSEKVTGIRFMSCIKHFTSCRLSFVSRGDLKVA